MDQILRKQDLAKRAYETFMANSGVQIVVPWEEAPENACKAWEMVVAEVGTILLEEIERELVRRAGERNGL